MVQPYNVVLGSCYICDIKLHMLIQKRLQNQLTVREQYIQHGLVCVFLIGIERGQTIETYEGVS